MQSLPEEFRRDENVWYSNDLSNITTERGWSLTWSFTKSRRSFVPLPSRAYEAIPPIGIAFHRRIAICQLSFDVEVEFPSDARFPVYHHPSWYHKSLPKMSVFHGLDTPKNRRVKWITQSPYAPFNRTDDRVSHKIANLTSRKYHYEFYLGDYGSI